MSGGLRYLDQRRAMLRARSAAQRGALAAAAQPLTTVLGALDRVAAGLRAAAAATAAFSIARRIGRWASASRPDRDRATT